MKDRINEANSLTWQQLTCQGMVTISGKPPQFIDDKASMKYYPFVIDFAGYVRPCRMMVEEAFRISQRQSYDNHTMPKPSMEWQTSVVSGAVQIDLYQRHDYFVDYPSVVKQVADKKREIELKCKEFPTKQFEITITSQIDGGFTTTSYIDRNGIVTDNVAMKVLGSSEKSASKVMSKEWNCGMKMEETAELTYSTIKCIDEYGLDKFAGLGGQEPRIYLIPSEGQVVSPSSLTYDTYKLYYEQHKKDLYGIML